jgi:DNA-binding MarR family transcriptional regulator
MVLDMKKNNFVRLSELLQLLYLRRRGLRLELYNKSAVHFTAIEAHILRDILSVDGTKAQSLCSNLKIEQSTMSRTLHRLEERKIIKTSFNQNNLRERELALTQKGRKYFLEMLKVEDNIIRECVKSLSAQQQNKISTFLDGITKEMGIPSLSPIANEHPLLLALIRISRLHGIHGTNLWGEDISATSYQILFLTRDFGGAIPFNELKRVIFLKSVPFNREIKILTKRKLVKQRKNPDDERSQVLELTKEGQIVLNQIEKGISETLCPRVEKSSVSIEQAILLLESIVWPERSESISPLSRNLEIRIISEEQDKNTLRGFLVKRSVEMDRQNELPAELFTSDSTAFALYVDSELRACCEITKSRDRKLLRNYAAFSIENGLASRFVVESAKLAGIKNYPDGLSISAPMMPRDI